MTWRWTVRHKTSMWDYYLRKPGLNSNAPPQEW
ncbi:hypothetical protein [Lactiplantibacillus sp. DA1]